MPIPTGQEWLVDVSGCSVALLRDVDALKNIFAELIAMLQLTVVGTPQWNIFPGEGGVTGLALLSESHLAVHTFPEHGYAAFSVYSCRAAKTPDFDTVLRARLHASSVSVHVVERHAATPARPAGPNA